MSVKSEVYSRPASPAYSYVSQMEIAAAYEVTTTPQEPNAQLSSAPPAAEMPAAQTPPVPLEPAEYVRAAQEQLEDDELDTTLRSKNFALNPGTFVEVGDGISLKLGPVHINDGVSFANVTEASNTASPTKFALKLNPDLSEKLKERYSPSEELITGFQARDMGAEPFFKMSLVTQTTPNDYSSQRGVLPVVRDVIVDADVCMEVDASCNKPGWDINDKQVRDTYAVLAETLPEPTKQLVHQLLQEIDHPTHATPLVRREMVEHIANHFYSCALQHEHFCEGTLHQHVLDARPKLQLTTRIHEYLYYDKNMLPFDSFVASSFIHVGLDWRRFVTEPVYRALSRLEPTSYVGEFFNPLVMAVMRGYLRSAANPLHLRV